MFIYIFNLSIWYCLVEMKIKSQFPYWLGICERIHDSISAAVALCGKHFEDAKHRFWPYFNNQIRSYTDSWVINSVKVKKKKIKKYGYLWMFCLSLEYETCILSHCIRINKTFYFHFLTPVLLLQPTTHLLLYLFGASLFYNSVKSNPALVCALCSSWGSRVSLQKCQA